MKRYDTSMNQDQPRGRNAAQFGWGIALIIAGLGVFYRIPQVLPKLAHIETFASAMWFIRFCFYLMGIILIGGGAQKIIRHFRSTRSEVQDEPGDS